MPFRINHLGTLWAGPLELPVRGDAWSDGAALVLLDEALGRRIVFETGIGLAPVQVATGAFNPAARVAVQMPEGSAGLSRAVFDAALGDPGRDGATWLQAGTGPASLARVMVCEADGAQVLLLASSTGSGVVSYLVGANGALSVRHGLPNPADGYLTQVSAMASLAVGGQTLVLVASGVAPGISVLSLGADGALTVLSHLGMQDGWPVAGITAMATAQIAGQSYVIVGAAGTNSLSVLRIAPDGRATPVDHVMDTLATRFESVRLVETVEVGGKVFVLAAGADDGLSLFMLLAGGRLVHLHSLADTADTALDNADWLHARAEGEGILILAGSNTEGGLSQFSVDLSALGTVGQTSGGSGRDIILDGPGSDVLQGGPGADLFVLRADGQSDRINDFQLGVDLIDLSGWPMYRGLHQLEVTEIASGLRLSFGDEVLDVIAANGAVLLPMHLWQMLAETPDRVTLTPGPISFASQPPPPVQQTPPPPVAPPPVVVPLDPPDPVPLLPAPAPGPFGPGKREFGTAGPDSLIGTAHADILSGLDGNDSIQGRGGDDTLSGGDGNDTIDGGEGNDLIGGGPGNDHLTGGPGDDMIGGGFGDDTIVLNAGNDVGSGGPGDDRIFGGAGNDTLAGGFGHDSIDGGGGDDNIGGGTGRDTLFGGLGNDRIGGGEGNDLIYGGSGNDFLAGGGREDTIYGGDGRDTINGGTGNDVLYGGAGPDLFVFNSLNAGERDVIHDFENGLDTIRITGVSGAGQAGRFAALDIANQPGGVRILYAGHEIFLTGVTASQLDMSDFLFL